MERWRVRERDTEGQREMEGGREKREERKRERGLSVFQNCTF